MIRAARPVAPGPVLVLAATVAAIAAALLGAAPAAAEERPMSPAEFRSLAEGWTLHFESDGLPYGAETFHPGARTTWQDLDGSCVEGRWWAHGAQICFAYEDEAEAEGAPPICWRMLRIGDGIVARLLGDAPDAGLELRLARRDRTPLLCGDTSV